MVNRYGIVLATIGFVLLSAHVSVGMENNNNNKDQNNIVQDTDIMNKNEQLLQNYLRKLDEEAKKSENEGISIKVSAIDFVNFLNNTEMDDFLKRENEKKNNQGIKKKKRKGFFSSRYDKKEESDSSSSDSEKSDSEKDDNKPSKEELVKYCQKMVKEKTEEFVRVDRRTWAIRKEKKRVANLLDGLKKNIVKH